MKPEIGLLGGSFYNYAEPHKSVYKLEDVVRALARESRFNGATEGDIGYPVAQHSFYVSLLVPEEIAMEALHHDDSEAVMKDLPKPLKMMLPGYSDIEKSVERDMFRRMGLRFPMDMRIKEADNIMLVTEMEDLQGRTNVPGYEGIKRAPFKVVPWTAKKAYEMFKKRHIELGGVWK
jgi:5'-deoxynucleotidase YfbR-like HD superfamily hydrolase